MMAKKKTAKKKVVLPKVVLPKGAKKKGASKKTATRQGSKWTVREVETQNKQMRQLLGLSLTVKKACEIVGISEREWYRRIEKDGRLAVVVKEKKNIYQTEEDVDHGELVRYINDQVKKDIEKGEKVTTVMKWWLGRSDRLQKQREDRAERRERARVEDGFRERQLQIQELQNKVDEEREKRLLIEAQERKVWKEMASERRSNLLWAARQVVEQKVKTGVPAEEIAVSCEVRGAQLSAIAKKYAAHLADEKQQGDFVFGKHGATQDEIENVDIWYEMAAKIRSKPGEFEKRA